MGYIRHDAIIVTAWDEERLSRAHAKARELKLPVSEVVPSGVNGYVSFLIAPDGSKEGWQPSDDGDKNRAAWKAWARDEKELWVDWTHIRYGGDDDDATIEEHSRQPAPNGTSSPTPNGTKFYET